MSGESDERFSHSAEITLNLELVVLNVNQYLCRLGVGGADDKCATLVVETVYGKMSDFSQTSQQG